MKDTWNVKFNAQGRSAKEIVTTILENRLIPKEAQQSFLTPQSEFIFPSNLLKNIDKAKDIFLKNNEHVLIYADTDSDGCSAAAILYHYMKAINPDITPQLFINKGKDHGVQEYFHIEDYSDVSLVVIVDSINDTLDPYKSILDADKSIIVLDHHIPKQEIIDFNHPDFVLVSSAVDYVNPHLSGAGVVWKFCRYLDYIYNTAHSDSLADLAAIGIIADVCSVGVNSMENRAICHLGMSNPTNTAIRALSEGSMFDSSVISFNIAPLINAANRMDYNQLALELFITDNSARVKTVIKELENVKAEQKEKVEAMYSALLVEGEKQKDAKCSFFFVTDAKNLAGLLATKLTANYQKPCIVVRDTGDAFEGSMRAEGVPDFSAIINASGLAECAGHENSAGISIPKQNLEPLKLYIENALSDITFTQSIDIDAKIERAQVTPFLLHDIKLIDRISGADFGAVRFLIDDVKTYEIKQLSKGKHLSVSTSDMKFLYWNIRDWTNVKSGNIFSAVGSLSENMFMGRKSIQMIMEDYQFNPLPHQNQLWF